MTATDSVPAGSVDQNSAGETLPPSPVCRRGMSSPAENAGLVTPITAGYRERFLEGRIRVPGMGTSCGFSRGLIPADPRALLGAGLLLVDEVAVDEPELAVRH